MLKYLCFFITLFISFSCRTTKNIDKDFYRYLPYSGNEVLYFRSSNSLDSLNICGYFSTYSHWGSQYWGQEREIKSLKCSRFNSKCDEDDRSFLAYLFYNSNKEIGLGINFSFKEKMYFFSHELLLKDSTKYTQYVDFFKKEVLVLNDASLYHSTSLLSTVYWDISLGLQGIKLKDGTIIRVEEKEQ